MAWRRCPSCNKGCSVDQGDAELNLDLEDNGDGEYQLTGDIRLVLNSGCCGDEIAEAEVEVPDIPRVTNFKHPEKESKKKHEVTIESENAESSSRTEGKGRGCRTYYGADVTVEVKCSCGWKHTIEFSVDEQASAYNETY